jgi:hypothetical protein
MLQCERAKGDVPANIAIHTKDAPLETQQPHEERAHKDDIAE